MPVGTSPPEKLNDIPLNLEERKLLIQAMLLLMLDPKTTRHDLDIIHDLYRTFWVSVYPDLVKGE